MTAPPIGSRVCWEDDDPRSPEQAGTVVAPTAEESAYVKTWSPTARAAVKGHVIVLWDGDELWDRAWADPTDLQVLEMPGPPSPDVLAKRQAWIDGVAPVWLAGDGS